MLVKATTESAKISRKSPGNCCDVLFFIRSSGGVPRLRAAKLVLVTGGRTRSGSRRHGKGFYNRSVDWKPSEGGREGTDLREGALIPPCQGPVAAGIIAEEGEEGGANAQIYS
jgi:hypothetical protein